MDRPRGTGTDWGGLRGRVMVLGSNRGSEGHPELQA